MEHAIVFIQFQLILYQRKNEADNTKAIIINITPPILNSVILFFSTLFILRKLNAGKQNAIVALRM